MSRKNNRGLTRRDFAKLTGAGAIATGVGANFLFPARAAAQQKTLKIIQWSHFVPAWDTWFNGTYTKEWGQKNNTNVIVDNIGVVDLPARGAAEASAKKGHDLFMFLSPPAAYEPQVLDMTPVYQEVEKKHGKKIDLALKSTYNPKTKKYFAFSDAYTPDPGNWHKDWWTEAGYPNGPDTYDDLLKGATKIREKTGHPCGIGLGQELDTSMAMRAILWSFGGAEQDEAGNVTINSKQTIEALKFMKELFQKTEPPEVFTWTPPSNNQAMLAGRVSYVMNAISITRQSEREQLPLFPQDRAGLAERNCHGSAGESSGQVQGSGQRFGLGHQRRLPRLCDGGHLGSVQHLGHPHHVRQRRSGGSDTGGCGQGGRRRVQAHLREMEVTLKQSGPRALVPQRPAGWPALEE